MHVMSGLFLCCVAGASAVFLPPTSDRGAELVLGAGTELPLETTARPMVVINRTVPGFNPLPLSKEALQAGRASLHHRLVEASSNLLATCRSSTEGSCRMAVALAELLASATDGLDDVASEKTVRDIANMGLLVGAQGTPAQSLQRLDADSNGALQWSEWRAAARDGATAAQMFAIQDSDGSSAISERELATYAQAALLVRYWVPEIDDGNRASTVEESLAPHPADPASDETRTQFLSGRIRIIIALVLVGVLIISSAYLCCCRNRQREQRSHFDAKAF